MLTRLTFIVLVAVLLAAPAFAAREEIPIQAPRVETETTVNLHGESHDVQAP